MACSVPTGVGEILASVQAVRVWVLSQILVGAALHPVGGVPPESSPYLQQDLAWSVGVLLRALAVPPHLSWTLIPSSLVGLWPLWGG